MKALIAVKESGGRLSGGGRILDPGDEGSNNRIN